MYTDVVVKHTTSSGLLFFLKVGGVTTLASASCEKEGRKKCPWLSNNRISGAWQDLLSWEMLFLNSSIPR